MTLPNPSAPKVEPSLSKNFFVWGNIALMAAIPWLLTQSMAGLAVGDPIFPDWFEIALLGLPAIALVTWIQWIQPISPFSLWFISKPVESLTEQERRTLSLISQKKNGWYVTGWIAIAGAIFMSAVFCKIYAASPLSQVIAPFPDQLRFFGVLWAEVFFLLSNVLLQSGVSALRVKLTANSDLTSLTPFAPEKIKNSFTHIGWRSPQLFTNDQSEEQVDSPVGSISPETLTEEITNVVEEQELEISDLVENEAIEELLEQEELEISDVAESEVVQDTFDDSANAETPDIVSEILTELAIENAAEQPAIENTLQTHTEEASEELEINDEELAVEEVFTGIQVDESLNLAGNFSESVTEAIEPEEIEPELVSKHIIVDEIESELVSEEIPSEEIESEQLFSAEETQITDSSETDAIANLEISDSAPDRKIGEDLETVQELEIVEEVIEELDISLEVIEVIDAASPDFKDELDELIAFNLYVENILQEYLEEESLDDATNNPSDTNNDEVVDITELTATSETAAAIAEEVLIAEEILEEDIPEPIIPPPTLVIPAVEDTTTNNLDDTNNDGVVDITELTATSETATAIAEEVLIAEEILEEGIPKAVEDLSTLETIEQKSDQTLSEVKSQEEPKTYQEPKQSAKYLVEEFLVDKYLAKLEQLNNADKNELGKESPEKTNTNVIQPIEPKLDEFAGLDELIDGKTINKKPVTED